MSPAGIEHRESSCNSHEELSLDSRLNSHFLILARIKNLVSSYFYNGTTFHIWPSLPPPPSQMLTIHHFLIAQNIFFIPEILQKYGSFFLLGQL